MPATTRYTRDHEWVRLDGDTATIGITAYAAEQLGDVVFVELPEVGRKVKKGEGAAVVESVKAASDVYSPVSGEVVGDERARSTDNPGTRERSARGRRLVHEDQDRRQERGRRRSSTRRPTRNS